MDETLNFSPKNEQDVRETFIRPLIRRLGYSDQMVTTQLPLTYQRRFLGHRKPAKDPALRGVPDYILDVDGRLRWVIDAKKPGPITDDDREQAFSYAMHPQVRAVLFALISGTDVEVFSTFEKPEAGPILAFKGTHLEAKWMELKSTVSPEALRRNFSKFTPDPGRPIAPGLRSYAKIVNGTLTYTYAPPFIENLEGIVVHVQDGSIVRRTEGGLEAIVIPSYHHHSLTAFSQAIKATELVWITSDETLSLDASKPSAFHERRTVVVPKGTFVPQLTSVGAGIRAPVTAATEAFATAMCYLEGNRVHGLLIARAVANGIHFEVRSAIDLTVA
jgi:hypothetical protein